MKINITTDYAEHIKLDTKYFISKEENSAITFKILFLGTKVILKCDRNIIHKSSELCREETVGKNPPLRIDDCQV